MSAAAVPAKKVLVVDDNEDVRCFLVELMRESGYDAISAPDGNQALRLVYQTSFDLVILDLVMPDCSGHQLIPQILAIDEGISIVVVSGYAGCLEQRSLKEMGVKRVLTKPFKSERLLEIAHILTGRERALDRLMNNTTRSGLLSPGPSL